MDNKIRQQQLDNLTTDTDEICKINGCLKASGWRRMNHKSTRSDYCGDHECAATGCHEIRLAFDEVNLVYCKNHHGQVMKMTRRGKDAGDIKRILHPTPAEPRGGM